MALSIAQMGFEPTMIENGVVLAYALKLETSQIRIELEKDVNSFASWQATAYKGESEVIIISCGGFDLYGCVGMIFSVLGIEL